jgi:type IV secretory pathway TrbL component
MDDTRITRKQAVFRRNISLVVGIGLLIAAVGVYYGTPFIEKQTIMEGPTHKMKTMEVTVIILPLLGLGLFITFIAIMFWGEWSHENRKGGVERK